MRCASCGSGNPDGSRFCRSCGARLAAPPPASEEAAAPSLPSTGTPAIGAPHPRRRRPGCITAYVLIALVAFVVLAALLLLALAGGLPPAALRLDPLTLLVIFGQVVVVFGLWRMRNWARVGVIALNSLNLLRSGVYVLIGGYRGGTGAGLAGQLLGVAVSLYVIYWLATHRNLFD